MITTITTAMLGYATLLAPPPIGVQESAIEDEAAEKFAKRIILTVETDKDVLAPGEWVRIGIWADTLPQKGQPQTVKYQGNMYQGYVSHFMFSLFDVHVETLGPMLPWPWKNFKFHPLMNYNTQLPNPSQYAIEGIGCSQAWAMYAYGTIDKNLPIEICSFYWQAPPVTQPFEYDLVIKGKSSPGYLNGSISCAVPALGKDITDLYWAMVHGHKVITVQPEGWCLVDCDGTGTLNIDDFVCFQTYFALGNLTADCDGDGVLLIDDFICFQTSFAMGC